MGSNPVERTLQGELHEIAGARRWLEGYMTGVGCDRRVIHDLKLVLTEALTNVVRHAYEAESGRIVVRLSLHDGHLVIHVRDWGTPISEAAWQAAALPAEPREGGYGIVLIRRYTDRTRYVRSTARGNLLVMKRRLSPARTP